MISTQPSFQKMAQRSAAIYLEPRFRQSGFPNRLLRYATRAFGMTSVKIGYF